MISNLAKKLFWIFMLVLLCLIFIAPIEYYETETKDKNTIMIVNKYSKICVVAEFDKKIETDGEVEKITYTMKAKTSGYAIKSIQEGKTYYLMECFAGYYVFEDEDTPEQNDKLDLVDCIKLWISNSYKFTIENNIIKE